MAALIIIVQRNNKNEEGDKKYQVYDKRRELMHDQNPTGKRPLQ